MQNATINQSTNPLLQILTSINAMLCATINQLTSGGHKSIPGKHLPQAWRQKINNQSMQCKLQQSIS
jgi:hypothetical protein